MIRSIVCATALILTILLGTSVEGQLRVGAEEVRSFPIPPRKSNFDFVNADNLVKYLSSELESYQSRYQQTYTKLTQLHEQLGIDSQTDSSFEEVRKALQTQRYQLKVELAGIQAKAKAIQSQQDKLLLTDDQKEIEADLHQNRIRILTRMHETLKRLEPKGSTSETQVLTAELQLQDAKREFAKSKRQGSKLPPAIKQKFFDVNLQLAEKKAMLDANEKMLRDMFDQQDKIRESKILERSLVRYFSEIESLQKELKRTLLVRAEQMKLKDSESKESKKKDP